MFAIPCAFFPSAKILASSQELSTYLVSPSKMVVSGSMLFIADENNNTVSRFDNKVRTAEIELPNIKKMVLLNDELFVLTTTTLYSLNLNLTTKTEISFPQSYPISAISDFSVSDTSLYILRDNGDIDTLGLSEGVATSPTTISRTYLEHINNESVTIIGIDYIDSKLSLNSSSACYLLDPAEQTVTIELSLSSGEEIAFKNAEYVITTTGKLINISTNSRLNLPTTNITGFTSSSDSVYYCSSKTHQVFKMNPETGATSDLGLNPEIEVNHFSKDSFIHIKAKENIKLFYMPYSVTESAVIETGTKLTIVGSFSNFYYCFYTDGETNRFLFLNKDESSYEELDISKGNLNFTATRTSNIYSLPSTIIDNNNKVISTLSASEEITVLNLTTIQNSAGELFFLVKVGNDYGFIRSNFLQSTKGAVELTTPCDAKTKRETTLFENADGTGKILDLRKGTRIALLEEISPTKDYVLAEFQDTNGVIYTGYIFTEDIDPDGLSTLQILGLILVGTNLALLLTILLIKKRSKKWKVSTPTERPKTELSVD